MFHCQKCKTGLYCSKECQAKAYGDHKVLCNAIADLEKVEQDRKFRDFTVSNKEPIPARLKKSLVKLVGERPLIKCMLNNRHCLGLWDTGSMVSLVSKNWLEKKFGKL